MSQNNIFVEGVALRQAVTSTNAIIGSMDNVRNVIANVQNHKAARWQGRAAARNATMFNDLDRAMRDYLTDARNTKRSLEEAAALYSTAEQTQVGNVRRLPTEGIF